MGEIQMIKAFENEGQTIELTTKGIITQISDFVRRGADTCTIDIQDFVLVSNREIENKENPTYEDFTTNGLPILDYSVYQLLSDSDKRKIKWRVDLERDQYTGKELYKSFVVNVYLVLIRGRAIIPSGERIPKFIDRFLDDKFTIQRSYDVLSYMGVDKYRYDYYMQINYGQFPDILRSRLGKGIAGMRIVSAFCSHEIDNKDCTPHIVDIQKKFREIIKVPCFDFHALFKPAELQSIPLNSNIENMMLLSFTESTLKDMVKNKFINNVPIHNPRAMHYVNWDDDFFSNFDNYMILDEESSESEDKENAEEVKEE